MDCLHFVSYVSKSRIYIATVMVAYRGVGDDEDRAGDGDDRGLKGEVGASDGAAKVSTPPWAYDGKSKST
jgi:hypothetical protein